MAEAVVATRATPMKAMTKRREDGLTLIEVLTIVVALIVVIAVAIPLWRTHELRTRRADAIEALLAVQSAQDRHFADHARYADGRHAHLAPPAGLGLSASSPRGHYTVVIERASDELGYVAIARTQSRGPGASDARCLEMRVDQHGRRSAISADGEDSSADCWNEL
jgi:type IV pilus assembly protein PilE